MVRVHKLFVSLLWKRLNKYFDLIELIDGMHRGEFPENEKELKCFTLCVAESAGAVNIINFRLFNRFKNFGFVQLISVNQEEGTFGSESQKTDRDTIANQFETARPWCSRNMQRYS